MTTSPSAVGNFSAPLPANSAAADFYREKGFLVVEDVFSATEVAELNADAARICRGEYGEISGVDRTHYCGAYWGWGFHEDGVVSGLRVCEELGVPGARGARTAADSAAIAGPADRDVRPDEDAEEAVAA